MRKSKLLTVLVAAVLGVSMVGCGTSAEAQAAQVQQVQWQIRINHYVGLTVSHQIAQQVNLIQQHLISTKIHIM